ncbi:hypothetical protein NQ314_015439 [Rhamnusium bicolor]|uniref:DDE-1 domain-containing protein n=1 Tax=Rhamnusium bicolor TaxID=1586634 RepID=A0AAV8WYW6_9CUCU|nr:hypothetical protein NQ314_015439 [Rhamnusium bicolor]
MGRIYKKKLGPRRYRDYDDAQLQRAVETVQRRHISYQEAEQRFECITTICVYKVQRIYDQWTIGGSNNSRYNRTKSGWFDAESFEDWFLSIVNPWAKQKQGTKVVIRDNLSSHLNVNIIVECQRHGIKFVFLPAHATHLTQPLDVGYYAPMKRLWRNIWQKYKLQNPREKNIQKNIESAFRATGIIPLNAQQVLKRLPNIRADENLPKTISETLLQYLKDIRTPSADTKKPRKKCSRLYQASQSF